MVESVMQRSNLILVLNDITQGIAFSDSLYAEIQKKYPNKTIKLIQNKTDLTDFQDDEYISALKGTKIIQLKDLIYIEAKNSTERVTDILINSRHAGLLKETNNCLENAINLIENNEDNELISIEIRKATKILGELTGESWNEEVLEHIFTRFCIGK
jgi:tRNA modification GTPase